MSDNQEQKDAIESRFEIVEWGSDYNYFDALVDVIKGVASAGASTLDTLEHDGWHARLCASRRNRIAGGPVYFATAGMADIVGNRRTNGDASIVLDR